MAKVSAQEQKEKKELAKEIMEFYGYKYNDWLYDMHFEYINNHVAQYVKDQKSGQETSSDNFSNKNNKENDPKQEETQHSF